VCAQRDKGAISELKQQLMKVAKRDEMARSELMEQKNAAEALAASSTEKLKRVKKEKIELETALDEVTIILVEIFVLLGDFSVRIFRFSVYYWPAYT